eukprot:XP_019927860.1 PREDICTED: growth arrest and DNA damage-inducible protein GADD45 gamma [Crassostrea gigas]
MVELCGKKCPYPHYKLIAKIGQALKDSLLQAVSEDRVVRGVMSCAKLLEVSPECVMVCILPASVPSHDVTFHIQQTLVEAFCVEHAIPILKIGDLEKLAVIFAGRKDVANSLENNQDEGEGDLTCLLVQVPEVKSPADQFVMEFCEMIFLPHPRIDLPA